MIQPTCWFFCNTMEISLNEWNSILSKSLKLLKIPIYMNYSDILYFPSPWPIREVSLIKNFRNIIFLCSGIMQVDIAHQWTATQTQNRKLRHPSLFARPWLCSSTWSWRWPGQDCLQWCCAHNPAAVFIRDKSFSSWGNFYRTLRSK